MGTGETDKPLRHTLCQPGLNHDCHNAGVKRKLDHDTRTALNRLDVDAKGPQLWVQATGGLSHLSSNGNSASVRVRNAGGLSLGVDTDLGPARVGVAASYATSDVKVDVRIVAATNEHLPELVDKGRFRADLLDRLCFEVVTLPPLRMREGDVAVLANHFGRRMAAELDWDRWPGFASHVMSALEDYAWPGNVRELRNVIERAVYRWGDFETPIAHVQFDPFDSPWRPRQPEHRRAAAPAAASAGRPAAPAPAMPDLDAVEDLRAAVDMHERAILEHALGKHRWNQRQTARALGLTYDQLRHAIRKHGLMDGQDGNGG